MFLATAGLLAATALGIGAAPTPIPNAPAVASAPAGTVSAAAPVVALGPNDALHLANRVNEVRAARGACPVALVGDMQSSAVDWANHLGAIGRLEHRALAGPLPLAENVGMGADGDRVQDLFMKSPGHMANIVDARFNEMGIGVFQTGSKVWVTYSFRSSDGQPHPC